MGDWVWDFHKLRIFFPLFNSWVLVLKKSVASVWVVYDFSKKKRSGAYPQL